VGGGGRTVDKHSGETGHRGAERGADAIQGINQAVQEGPRPPVDESSSMIRSFSFMTGSLDGIGFCVGLALPSVCCKLLAIAGAAPDLVSEGSDR